MQPPLPLAELTAPAPLAWEQLAPDNQTEAVMVLARLMAKFVQPNHGEEHDDD